MKIEDLPAVTCDVCGGKAYLIGTETELATVMRHAQDTVDETVPGLSYCYKVGEELASRSVDITLWGAYQIGTAEDAPFTGHFDFSGLTIQVNGSAEGLFPYVGKNAETNQIGYVTDLTIYQDGNGPVVSTKVFGGGVIDGVRAYPVYAGTVQTAGLVKQIGNTVANSADYQLDAAAVGTLKNSSIIMSTRANAPVTYKSYGALVFYNAGLIDNCHARYSDSDEYYNNAGGLTHNGMGNSVVRNCSNTIPSNGVKTLTGGYFGGIEQASWCGQLIQNCSVKMGTLRSTYNVNSNDNWTGGIIGRIITNAAYEGKSGNYRIENCRVEGDALYGGTHCGGMIGQAISGGTRAANIEIVNCYVRFDTLRGYYDVGGLIGDVDSSGINQVECSVKLYNNTVIVDTFESTRETNWASMGGFVSYIWGVRYTVEIKNCNGFFKNFIGLNTSPLLKCSPIVAIIGSNHKYGTPSTMTISDTLVKMADGKIEKVAYAGSILGGVYRANSGWTVNVDRVSTSGSYQKNGTTYYPQVTKEVGYVDVIDANIPWTYNRGTKVYDANAAGTPADYIMPDTLPDEVMQPAAGYESQERSKLTATFSSGELTLKIDLKTAYAGYRVDSLYYSLHGGTWNSDTQLVYQGKICGNVGAGYAFGDGVSSAGEITLKAIAGEYKETNLCVKVKLIKGEDTQWVTLYGDGAVAENL